MKFGLIGYPLHNTFSVSYFGTYFAKRGLEHLYQNYPLSDVELLDQLILAEHLQGFNVTLPHKIAIMPKLQHISEEAGKIGAVNCVKVNWNTDHTYMLEGHNTDAYGFRKTLMPLLKPWHQQALILGSGGASLAVQYVLKQLGIHFRVVSRLPNTDLMYEDVSEAVIRTHQIIINCTPLGMHPNTSGIPPIPFHAITDLHLAYDLIYIPEMTLFLEECLAQGATVCNGLNMLHEQANKSWDIWNEK